MSLRNNRKSDFKELFESDSDKDLKETRRKT